MRLVCLSKGMGYRPDRLLCNQNTPVHKNKNTFKEIILLCKNKRIGKTGSDSNNWGVMQTELLVHLVEMRRCEVIGTQLK